MVEAQKWLEENYPKNGTCVREKESWQKELENHKDFGKTREEIKRLDTGKIGLEGTLDLSDFSNLEELFCFANCLTNLNINNCKKLWVINCSNNQLTTLDLSNLEELKMLLCSNNYLTRIIYPTNPKKITELYITNNNLSPQDLSIFKIGNSDKNKINQNIYNNFQGSLEPLKDLNRLRVLEIPNTDIDSEAGFSKEQTKKIFTELNKDTELVRPDLREKYWSFGTCKECNQPNTKRSKVWDGKNGEYKNYKTVALKTLTNSQNMNQDFLQELTLYKLFKKSNYIMVMEYMKEGNLREFLKKNKELKFYDKEMP
ncbi:11232_t:CDS:2 [Racocetra fulgida]|uniref:11232_t:CDS:1 n=1 Tax=Racocetra fulgida TaxID=60492 RepID=A0A9N8VBA5_9GLOM|nr:11232_t:CDS:2 [Racocetra fulgida]